MDGRETTAHWTQSRTDARGRRPSSVDLHCLSCHSVFQHFTPAHNAKMAATIAPTQTLRDCVPSNTVFHQAKSHGTEGKHQQDMRHAA